MFSLLPVMALLGLSGAVLSQCPVAQLNHVCCEAYGTFGDDEYVWHDVCGIDANSSTTVGSNCESTTAFECQSGLYSLCCETLSTCGGGVDGPISLNCTQLS